MLFCEVIHTCWKGKQISLTLNSEVREDVEPTDFSGVRETVAPPWLRTLAESTLPAEGLNLVGAVHTTAVSDCGLKPNALKTPQKDEPCPESMQIQLPCGSFKETSHSSSSHETCTTGQNASSIKAQ